MGLGVGRALHYLSDQLDYYQLVAFADDRVSGLINAERNWFVKNFDQKNTFTGRPFIPVADFYAREEMEGVLNRWIQNICSLQPAFDVSLHNFSAFPPGNIFWRIQDHLPFQQLANRLKIIDGFIQSNDCPPVSLITKPNITLASGLSEVLFNQVVAAFSQREFYETFRVEKLMLQKSDRTNHTTTLVNTFTFSHF